MKITIDSKPLIKHLKDIQSVMRMKTDGHDIIKKLYLKAFNGALHIQCYRDGVEVSKQINCRIHDKGEGECLVDYILFRKCVESFNYDFEMETQIDFDNVHDLTRYTLSLNLWQDDDISMNIKADKTDLWPLVPLGLDEPLPGKVIEPVIIHHTVNHIWHIFKEVGTFSSKDINRGVLNGICWRGTPTSDIFAATDGRKVIEITYNRHSQMYDSRYFELIIPTKIVNTVLKLIKRTDDDLIHNMTIQYPGTDESGRVGSRIEISTRDVIIAGNLINHKYPDYEKAYPYSNTENLIEAGASVLVVNKTMLSSLILRASKASSDNNRVMLSVTKEAIEIMSKSHDIGTCKIVHKNVSGSRSNGSYLHNGPNYKVSFNYKFMLDILKVARTESVVITAFSYKDPIMIYNADENTLRGITKDAKERYLLMSLRSLI